MVSKGTKLKEFCCAARSSYLIIRAVTAYIYKIFVIKHIIFTESQTRTSISFRNQSKRDRDRTTNNEFLKFQLIFSQIHDYIIPTERPTRFYKIHLFVQMQLPRIDSILWMWWWWVSLSVQTKSNFDNQNRQIKCRANEFWVLFHVCYRLMNDLLFIPRKTYTREWELLLKIHCFFILFVIWISIDFIFHANNFMSE